MAVYRTVEGDVLDLIAYRELGDERLVIAILKANPRLAEMPPVLPAGVEIELPEAGPVTPGETIRLWGSA